MAHDVPALKVVEEVEYTWCFAGVEQVLRKVFGKADISQTEIAHNSAIRLAGTAGGTSTHWQRATEYAQRAIAQLTGDQLKEVEGKWAEIRPTLTQRVTFQGLKLEQDGLRDRLRRCYGEIDLKPFTTALVEKPYDVLTIAGELGDKKLVIAGNELHWYVIYGYDYDEASKDADETRKYRYLVYDVHGGESLTRTASFTNLITDLFVVGA
ncbi:MAG: hypothetical protein HOV83_25025 [Catenulispora sp.]|nr:hypothetical protein [Catenulispora sp.]